MLAVITNAVLLPVLRPIAAHGGRTKTDSRFRGLLNCLLSVLLSDRKPENEEHNSYAQGHSNFVAKHAYHEEHKCNEKESIA